MVSPIRHVDTTTTNVHVVGRRDSSRSQRHHDKFSPSPPPAVIDDPSPVPLPGWPPSHASLMKILEEESSEEEDMVSSGGGSPRLLPVPTWQRRRRSSTFGRNLHAAGERHATT